MLNVKWSIYCKLMSSNIDEGVDPSGACVAASKHNALKTLSSKLWCVALSHVWGLWILIVLISKFSDVNLAKQPFFIQPYLKNKNINWIYYCTVKNNQH